MSYRLANFSPQQFLKSYWQKKPAVFRQVFPGFEDPLDENDLAGLAQDPDADSRIIQHHNGQWSVHHGPFDDFSEPCQGKWTLLVQAVDHFLEEGSSLMDCFGFIPYWRMDDLMVSFAVAGAGVGPHTDQYDVFLVQGKGSRRWQVGAPGNYPSLQPHPDLCQIAPFEPIIDVELHPGDVLYVPPGWPHNGTAVSDCMTYSVGFRAPDQSQLLQYLLDHVLASPSHNLRYTDPDLCVAASPGAVTSQHLSALTALLKSSMESRNWPNELLRCLSEQNLTIDVPERLYTEQQILQLLEDGAHLQRLPGCRPLYAESKLEDTERFTFYVDGESFSIPAILKSTAIPVLEGAPVSTHTLEQTVDKLDFLQLLCKLTNKGLWFFTDE
ncbi:cupin domain-containing protein [Alteromonas aestuariivivens]|uniref:Cupin domain-containing protein n=1 Tax=Alteromonas aestuariivivens TaxID=1938339 RepID=A0A3D8M988_9ALTE|nr:cupin domain-containing protein [Alteromonas aestuariivivens]RDV26176.1 cupin domain-containing protein [Alteromonas aestuariivivens]